MLQTGPKRVQDKKELDGEVDPPGIGPETEISSY